MRRLVGFGYPWAVVAPILVGVGVADPQVESAFSEPILDERHLERLDHLLPLGVRRAEPAIALDSRGCYLISRPCHHGAFPSA